MTLTWALILKKVAMSNKKIMCQNYKGHISAKNCKSVLFVKIIWNLKWKYEKGLVWHKGTPVSEKPNAACNTLQPPSFLATKYFSREGADNIIRLASQLSSMQTYFDARWYGSLCYVVVGSTSSGYVRMSCPRCLYTSITCIEGTVHMSAASTGFY